MPLLDENDNTDLDEHPITCLGSWVSPENIEQCRSAISSLHKARNMIGAYEKPCLECIDLDKQEQSYLK